MSIKKLSIMLLSAVSLAAFLSGCGSSSKLGNSLGDVAKVDESKCRVCHAASIDPVSKTNIVQDFIGGTNPTTNPPSVHYQIPDAAGPLEGVGCQGCHGGGAQHNGVGPLPYSNPLTSGRCNAVECHNGIVEAGFVAAGFVGDCDACHSGNSIHSIGFAIPPAANLTAYGAPLGTPINGVANGTPFTAAQLHDDCINCHTVTQEQHSPTTVNDNNGVRAITGEFAKWSHHVTGVTLQNAHCAACHLEGKVVGAKIVVDRTYHMVDNKTHLRNADTDADMQWNPAAPNHGTMDNFCMSCHDANGATSPKSAAIRALMVPAAGKTASATNPFGDTISNRYDKMQRPAVVDVDGQFDTGNTSHHAVKGPKYTGRTRTAGSRQIANAAAFNGNSSATLWGKRSTIYDSVNATTGAIETTNKAFNALYVPLENAGGEAAPRTGAASLGDDSTLHCGDCHTVGQWKAGTAKSFNPVKPATTEVAGFISPAIGAHGSNNEYMLRNSRGTDERHTQDAYVTVAGVTTVQNTNAAFLVCFNCHSYSRYGSVYGATGATGPHAGEYDSSGRCNGVGNTLPFNGYTTGKATDGTQFESRLAVNMRTINASTTIAGKTYTASSYPAVVNVALSTFATTPAFAPGFPPIFAKASGGVQNTTYTGEQDSDFGNIFGIQCNNCHNSGVENGYGGIHGSKVNTYVDGMGNTQKMRRFLPGLGNTKYVPGTLGGIIGGTTAGPVTNTRNTAGADQIYTYTTGGVSNDTNWEQVESKRRPSDGAAQYSGAGCYTLTEASGAATSGQKGLSVDGGATTPEAYGTWGACDDHGAVQGAGDHGVVKRINRPVTY